MSLIGAARHSLRSLILLQKSPRFNPGVITYLFRVLVPEERVSNSVHEWKWIGILFPRTSDHGGPSVLVHRVQPKKLFPSPLAPLMHLTCETDEKDLAVNTWLFLHLSSDPFIIVRKYWAVPGCLVEVVFSKITCILSADIFFTNGIRIEYL